MTQTVDEQLNKPSVPGGRQTENPSDGEFQPLPTAGSRATGWLHSLLEGRGWTLVRILSDLGALTLLVAIISESGIVSATDAGVRLLWLYPVLTVAALGFRNLYRPDENVPRLDAIARIAGGVAVTSMVLIALVGLAVPDAPPARLVGPAWLGGTLVLVLTHVGFEWARRTARSRRIGGKRTLIVGAGRVGAKLERWLREQPELGLNPIGFVDEGRDGGSDDGGPSVEAPLLAHPSELRAVIKSTGAEHVILAFLPIPDSAVLPLIRDCESLGVGISVVPRFFETTSTRLSLTHIGSLPLFRLRRVDPKSWQFTVKHVVDRLTAAALILVVSPLLLAITLAVRLSSSGPILFRQTRIGRDGLKFNMLKFRTMREADPADQRFELAPDTAPGGVEGVDRRTRIGTLLRKTSLDELPQLLNVLRGDMSLVGPRPERPEFARTFSENVERYTDRHRVKSGITGWAQVHGLRGKTSLDDRVEWDNYYIENWSLWLDLKILLMTVIALQAGE